MEQIKRRWLVLTLCQVLAVDATIIDDLNELISPEHVPVRLPYDIGGNQTLCQRDMNQPAVVPNVYSCAVDSTCCLRGGESFCCAQGDKMISQDREMIRQLVIWVSIGLLITAVVVLVACICADHHCCVTGHDRAFGVRLKNYLLSKKDQSQMYRKNKLDTVHNILWLPSNAQDPVFEESFTGGVCDPSLTKKPKGIGIDRRLMHRTEDCCDLSDLVVMDETIENVVQEQGPAETLKNAAKKEEALPNRSYEENNTGVSPNKSHKEQKEDVSPDSSCEEDTTGNEMLKDMLKNVKLSKYDGLARENKNVQSEKSGSPSKVKEPNEPASKPNKRHGEQKEEVLSDESSEEEKEDAIGTEILKGVLKNAKLSKYGGFKDQAGKKKNTQNEPAKKDIYGKNVMEKGGSLDDPLVTRPRVMSASDLEAESTPIYI